MPEGVNKFGASQPNGLAASLFSRNMMNPSTARSAGSGQFSATPAATSAQSGVVQESVVVSLSVTSLAPSAPSALSDTGAAAAAGASVTGSASDGQAERALDALTQIKQANAQSADAVKGFLRQKLDGLKKQLQLLRMLGTDAMEIAKGSVRIARAVAGSARDYAAATIAQKQASGSTFATDKQAGQQAQELQNQAAAAPLSDAAASDNPAGAPTDPDKRFFFEAFRVLNLAKKTLVQAQEVDQRVSGSRHDKEFKKLRHHEGTMEQAVANAFRAVSDQVA